MFSSLSDESNSRYIISTHSFITFKDICGKDLIIMVVHWEKFIFFHSFLKQILFIIMIVLRQISWSMFIFRSSHPEVFIEKGVPKICSKFTGEYPWRSVISIKLLCNFIEITLRHGCSPVNLLYIFRAPFPKNTSGRLFLISYII